MMLEIIEKRQNALLKVIGCGGAGGNAVNHMLSEKLTGVDFIAANSDHQALDLSLAPHRIQLGKSLTKGLGCGGVAERGRRAAEEDESEIRAALTGADMIFITAGMGGGTGTGSAPVVARIAREMGALTVAVVTKPFTFEGRRRQRQAEEGLRALRETVDTLITIPNERLMSVVDRDTPISDAFKIADQVLLQATKGISDLVLVPGLVNLDFADVREVMAERGNALMGTGVATGPERAALAARMAVASPLLEDVSIAGAEALLVNICGGPGLSLHEVHEANSIIVDAAGDEANVIFGAVIDPTMGDEIRITVIATGFGRVEHSMPIFEPDVLRPTSRPTNGNGFGYSRPTNRIDTFSTRSTPHDRPYENGRNGHGHHDPMNHESRHETPGSVAIAAIAVTSPVPAPTATGRSGVTPSAVVPSAPVTVRRPYLDEETETRQIRQAQEEALRLVRENLRPIAHPVTPAESMVPRPEAVEAVRRLEVPEPVSAPVEAVAPSDASPSDAAQIEAVAPIDAAWIEAVAPIEPATQLERTEPPVAAAPLPAPVATTWSIAEAPTPRFEPQVLASPVVEVRPNFVESRLQAEAAPIQLPVSPAAGQPADRWSRALKTSGLDVPAFLRNPME